MDPNEISSAAEFYTYEGRCPSSGRLFTLKRTPLVEEQALALARDLPEREGKMYGVLLVEDPNGIRSFLKAFSGKLDGTFHHEGWAPPLLELEPTPLEEKTKTRLQEIRNRLGELTESGPLSDLVKLESEWEQRESILTAELLARQNARRSKRQAGGNHQKLTKQSQRDSKQKHDFKLKKRGILERAKRLTEPVFEEMRQLKKERKELSRTLQAELHAAFSTALWSDRPWSLVALFPSGPPTGTGDCCAPKLLHWASQRSLKPLALAEIWWGPDTESRRRGEFYPPCSKRCQPLLGALLSPERFQLEVLLETDHYLAFNKPSGLLTVPGAERWSQDCLQLRAQRKLGPLFSVHRLDLETSGIVLFAKDPDSQRELQKLFSTRAVQKTYHAVLQRPFAPTSGEIALPLGPDPSRKGTYRPASDGKEALTYFRELDSSLLELLRLEPSWNLAWRHRTGRLNAQKFSVEFRPHTGRSHQLRVHAAFGLNSPILGDRLYGSEEAESEGRLHLHATRLQFVDPFRNCPVDIHSPTPFL